MTMDTLQQAVARVPNQDAMQVISVFCDAFHRYPVFRYVLDAAANPKYNYQLKKLIGLFVTARVLRNEPMFGVTKGSALVAAMTTSVPDASEPSEEFHALREAVWAELGAAARARYDQCTAKWTALAVDVPQLHVNMIGVRPAFQRTGLAVRLLKHVHELSRYSVFSEGVSLTTEEPRNVAFYQHLGYRIVGHDHITPDMATWGFFRRND
jgi:GNAT superfamily N-acetyltransferase